MQMCGTILTYEVVLFDMTKSANNKALTNSTT